MAWLIDEYNHVRLHAALEYLERNTIHPANIHRHAPRLPCRNLRPLRPRAPMGT